MKHTFRCTFKSGARLLATAMVGSTLAACSNTPPNAPAENAAPNAAEHAAHDESAPNETAHDKTSSPKTYADVGGQIVSVNAPAKNVVGAKTTVTLDHEDIPNFMRAMRMTIPLQNPDDAKRLKKGHKIRCDFVMENGSLALSHIRVLPPDTKLKLAPA
jgi:Cu/Ag efflux protein CusF